MRDMTDVHMLLSIAEKTLQWPKLKALHDQAMQALEEHAKNLVAPAPASTEEDKPPIEKEMSGESSVTQVRPTTEESDGETDIE